MADKENKMKSFAEIDSEKIEKFNKNLKEFMDREKMMYKRHQFNGNKMVSFNLEPLPHERQRLDKEMTDEDRFLRKQFFQDLALAPNEPVLISQLPHMNPIRKLIRLPMDLAFFPLKPILGERLTSQSRYLIPKFGMAFFTCCYIWYHLKYNPNSWTDHHGINMYRNKPISFDLSSKKQDKELDDFFDRGFKNRKVLRN